MLRQSAGADWRSGTGGRGQSRPPAAPVDPDLPNSTASGSSNNGHRCSTVHTVQRRAREGGERRPISGQTALPPAIRVRPLSSSADCHLCHRLRTSCRQPLPYDAAFAGDARSRHSMSAQLATQCQRAVRAGLSPADSLRHQVDRHVSRFTSAESVLRQVLRLTHPSPLPGASPVSAREPHVMSRLRCANPTLRAAHAVSSSARIEDECSGYDGPHASAEALAQESSFPRRRESMGLDRTLRCVTTPPVTGPAASPDRGARSCPRRPWSRGRPG